MTSPSSSSSSSASPSSPPSVTPLPPVPALPSSRPVPEVSSPALADGGEKILKLVMSWSGKTYPIQIPDNDRIFDLKILIWSLTQVPPERIKLLGLSSKQPDEDVVLSSLSLKADKKFMMLGTPLADSFKDPTRLQGKEIVDDFDVDYARAEVPPHLEPRNVRKVREHSSTLQLDLINPPRPGQRLLVLDLDYTLVDTKPLLDGSLPATETARPGLHEFLQEAYKEYDIAIWSQTSWRWLESKLTELGMIGEEDRRGYKISFVVDRRPMFTIFTSKNGQPYKHEVKALQLLWNRFPEHYGPHNTIHIDDLSRNFALNPQHGLKIKAFKGAGTDAGSRDKELPRLSTYLSRLAQLEDFRALDHNKDWARWRKEKQ